MDKISILKFASGEYEIKDNELTQKFNEFKTDISADLTHLEKYVDDEVNTLETSIHSTNTTVAQNQIKNDRKFKDIAINIREYSHLVIGDDWTNALQTALNECDDEGDVILIPFKIEIKNTIKFPTSSKSDSKLKAITIMGVKHGNDDSPVGSDTNGKSVIHFTGSGILFDLTGNIAGVNSTVSLKNLSLIGDKKIGTTAIHAEQLKKTVFDGLTIRDFDKGLVVNSYSFYSTFRNLVFLNNRLIGAEFNQRINGSTIESCKFNQTYEGIGLKLQYIGNGNVISYSYFEQNAIAGIKVERTDQLTLVGNYFEKNNTHLELITTSSETMVVTLIGNGFSHDVNMTNLIITRNNVILNLIGNRFKLNKSISKIITRAGTGLKLLVINNMFEGEFPFVEYTEAAYLTSLEDNNIKTTNVDVVNRLRVNVARVSNSGVSGNATKKYELLDLNGNRIGFIPIHDS